MRDIAGRLSRTVSHRNQPGNSMHDIAYAAAAHHLSPRRNQPGNSGRDIAYSAATHLLHAP